MLLGIAEIEMVTFTPDGLFMQLLFDDVVAVVRRGSIAWSTGGWSRILTDRACENCGFADDELVLVRRVYVVPETWDQPGSATVVEEPELWCVSCC